jgi:uncharacterized protein YdiU (UPF0061 family)
VEKKRLTRFAELPWESTFVSRFPGDPQKENFTRGVQDVLYSEVSPTPVANPELVGWSEPLASELGISRPAPGDRDSLELLSGNRTHPKMKAYAARYGGHQFGQWAGQLGDGRAITMGEARFPQKLEFQLKGAGPTPYSRRADGRAVLRSSVREFVCSEAMHALGVPTTRALSLVLTGDSVTRDMFYDGNAQDEPGAIVCRVAPSFLRFGNFEILAANGEHALLERLANFLIEEHYPELTPGSVDGYAKLLDEICRRTAVTVAHWMRVGFVHGVMNTDNMSALGLTIDYGPYGWLEPYDPDWTPNTTDASGRRYRFGHQPAVAQWNLERLCEAFHPLIPDQDRLRESLRIFQDAFGSSQRRMLAQKLGLDSLEMPENLALAESAFVNLAAAETDFTVFFRALCDWSPPNASDASSDEAFWRKIQPAFYAPDAVTPDLRGRWFAWARDYSTRLLSEGRTAPERSSLMKQVNPKYVPRNYLAQTAIMAAEKGDYSVLDRLMRVLGDPYSEQPGEEALSVKRPDWARDVPGCSALSCSS